MRPDAHVKRPASAPVVMRVDDEEENDAISIGSTDSSEDRVDKRDHSKERKTDRHQKHRHKKDKKDKKKKDKKNKKDKKDKKRPSANNKHDEEVKEDLHADDEDIAVTDSSEATDKENKKKKKKNKKRKREEDVDASNKKRKGKEENENPTPAKTSETEDAPVHAEEEPRCDAVPASKKAKSTPPPASSSSSLTPPGAVTASSSGARKPPRKQPSMLTHQAALSMASSCQLTSSEFHDFVCARSFDVISGGMYRKFLVQSRASKEDWAFKVQTSIGKVQKILKTLAGIVQTLRHVEMQETEWAHIAPNAASRAIVGKRPLSVTLHEVMNSTSPPVRKRVDSVRPYFAKLTPPCLTVCCVVTGVELDDECIELRACGKGVVSPAASFPASADGEDNAAGVVAAAGGSGGCKQTVFHPPVVAHPALEHFFHMFWYCSKIEHVVRQMARSWMEDNGIVLATPAASSSNPKKGCKGSVCGDDSDGCAVAGTADHIDGCDENVDESVEEIKAGSHANDEDSSSSGGGSKKTIAAGCVEKNGVRTSSADGEDMQAACELFSNQQAEVIREMHLAMRHAFSHVIESIYGHPSLKQRKSTLSGMLAAATAGASDAPGRHVRDVGESGSDDAGGEDAKELLPRNTKRKVSSPSSSSPFGKGGGATRFGDGKKKEKNNKKNNEKKKKYLHNGDDDDDGEAETQCFVAGSDEEKKADDDAADEEDCWEREELPSCSSDDDE